MKTVKKVLITLFVIILILALSFLGLRYIIYKLFNTKYIGMEKEIEQFKNNITTYENTAQTLSSITGENDIRVIHGIIRNPDFLPNEVPERTYYYLENNLRLELLPSRKVGANEIKMINQSSTWKVLKELDYELIIYGKDWVFFINRARIGGSIGILYYTGEMPEYVRSCEINKIMDNWYHCFSG